MNFHLAGRETPIFWQTKQISHRKQLLFTGRTNKSQKRYYKSICNRLNVFFSIALTMFVFIDILSAICILFLTQTKNVVNQRFPLSRFSFIDYCQTKQQSMQ